jgi:hypothetical protein
MTTEALQAWALLRGLEGDWTGSGEGKFPTIDDFAYTETLSVRPISTNTLQYEQKTWRVTGDGEVPSHHEIGFFGVGDDQSISMTSAHGLDRVEVMSGLIRETAGGFHLALASTSLAHDERMISSWRELILTTDHLHYDMGMATKSTPDGAHHLSADLYRVST